MSPNTMVTSGAVGGQSGSHFRAVLSYSKAVATYVVNEANFAGLGIYLPSYFFLATSIPANVTVTIADAGGTDRQCGAAGGGFYYADGVVPTATAGCVKIVVATGTTTVVFFIVGMI